MAPALRCITVQRRYSFTCSGAVVANVTVRRCSVRSRSSAIKFGSNCPIPMYNLTFEDLYVHDSNRGLAIQVR